TIKDAILDLEFKNGTRDVSEFKNMPLDTVKSPEEWAVIYRLTTGACRTGIEMFMKSKGKLKKQYSLAEILDETKDAYNGDMFNNLIRGNV
ncbi:MAG: hypothetical protein CV087_22660, partial [Candidatus Brocadia sp. WS118]